MSNPQLLRLVRGGQLQNGGVTRERGAPSATRFEGETVSHFFSAAKRHKAEAKHGSDEGSSKERPGTYDRDKPDFSQKDQREEPHKKTVDTKDAFHFQGSGAAPGAGGGGDGKGDTSGKNGFPAKGSDGDGDGKKNEKKKPGKKGDGDWDDKDGDGKPNKVDKDDKKK